MLYRTEVPLIHRWLSQGAWTDERASTRLFHSDHIQGNLRSRIGLLWVQNNATIASQSPQFVFNFSLPSFHICPRAGVPTVSLPVYYAIRKHRPPHIVLHALHQDAYFAKFRH